MSEETFNSSEVQVTGKIAFILSIILPTTSLITNTTFTPNMEIINTTLLIISSALGIVFICLKIWMIRIQIIEANEERFKNGEKPIKFFQFWKINRKKSD